MITDTKSRPSVTTAFKSACGKVYVITDRNDEGDAHRINIEIALSDIECFKKNCIIKGCHEIAALGIAGNMGE